MDVAPAWILAAILRVETGTQLGAFGPVRTQAVHRGRDGERGVMQIRYGAFKDVARPGESFDSLDTNDHLSIDIGNRYLCKMFARFKSWDKAIMAYNAGAGNLPAGAVYLQKVKRVKLGAL